jgi:hypothetical protein
MAVGSSRASSWSVETGDAMPRGGPTTTDEALVALLRATLGTGEAPDLRQLAACDWTRLETLAAHHAVIPIVYRAVESRADAVPRHVLRRMWLGYRATVLRNRAVADLVADFSRRLSPASVACILLKGASLVRTLYTDPGLRHVGDLDLLVDERDVPRAASLLDVMGFRRFGRPLRTEWPSCEFHLVYVRDGHGSIPVELHWRLFQHYLPYVFELSEVRERALPVAALPTGMFTMSPEHELAHLCLHLERHAIVYRSLIERPDWLQLLVMLRGLARLAWLYDVALYLQRRGGTLDWDRLVGDARRWAIDARLRVVLELCERTLHIGAPAEVIRALGRGRPGFVERGAHRAIIALNRVSERVDRRWTPSRRLHGWLDLLGDRATGWSHMWNSVFPPASYLAARHPGHAPTIQLCARHVATMVPPVLHAIGRRLRLERPSAGVASTLGAGQAMVVVPAYEAQPNALEAVSWHRCLEVFPRTPIALLAPEGLDLSAYLPPERQEARPIHVVRFDPGFFQSTATYSRLLLSAGFYRTFLSYEFILIYQLDGFVFRDELADWCARGYDYIGAPWIDCAWLEEARHAWSPKTRDNVVGNGGFSLRRVAPALKLLTEQPEVAEQWGGNEDQFWAFKAPAWAPFKIPTLEEAVAFSFEVSPERAFALNGSKLPFGCHGWSHGDLIEFWRPVLKGYGYEV